VAVSDTARLGEPSVSELEALRGAAVWYAKYHAADVERNATERAAYAVAEREEYLALIAALGKLGVRLRIPDGLLGATRAA
jgi:hypothetical protein